MKKLSVFFGLALCLIFSLPVQAQTRGAKKSIERLVKKLEVAYLNSSLGSLDAIRPIFRSVKIVIEHSLAGDTDKDRFEIKVFKTLAEGEQWLKRREREDGTPFRNLKPLSGCGKGRCSYDFFYGILHNQLYLKKVAYGYRNGRPYIRTIYLLDGD